jgi:hypothetical protein
MITDLHSEFLVWACISSLFLLPLGLPGDWVRPRDRYGKDGTAASMPRTVRAAYMSVSERRRWGPGREVCVVCLSGR